MTHEEYITSQKEELRILLEEDIGGQNLIPLSRKISSKWRMSKLSENNPDFLFIVGLDSMSDHLPHGEVREHWNKEALKEKDIESQEFHAFYLEDFLNARIRLLKCLMI